MSPAMDESPELPKRNSTAPAGPFVLVNVEALETAINDAYSTVVEDLADMRAVYRNSGLDDDVSRVSAMISAYTDMKDKAIEAIRRAAGGSR
jgi:hypothetical protein